MHPETAKAALVFLSRATIQGGEVPTFVRVVQDLEVLASPAPLPAPGERLVDVAATAAEAVQPAPKAE